MGAGPSGPHDKPVPPGCWRYNKRLSMSDPIDCDCRFIGYCPPGPPPYPPIWEFLDLFPNEVVPVPRPDPTPQPYKEDWGGNKANPTWDDEEGDIRRRGELALLSDAASLHAELPLEIKGLLYKTFGGSVWLGTKTPAMVRSTKDALDVDMERFINNRLVLATYLARPQLAKVPQEAMGAVLRCTVRALEEVEKYNKYLHQAAQEQRQMRQNEVKILGLLNITNQALQRANTAQPGGNVTSAQASKPGWPKNTEADTLCHDVFGAAVKSIEEKTPEHRYVPSFEEIMAGLEAEIGKRESLGLRPLNTSVVGMSWDEQETQKMLGQSYAAMAIGMDYLSLSLRGLPGLLG